MSNTEYTIKRSRDNLVIQRSWAWALTGLFGAMFPLAGLALVGQSVFGQPPDGASVLMLLVISAWVAFILYKLLLCDRRLVFDRQRDRFLIDGRVACRLSDLTEVRLEVARRDTLVGWRWGTFVTLRLMTVQGRSIWIKSAPGRGPGQDDLKRLGVAMADFAGIRSNMAGDDSTGGVPSAV